MIINIEKNVNENVRLIEKFVNNSTLENLSAYNDNVTLFYKTLGELESSEKNLEIRGLLNSINKTYKYYYEECNYTIKCLNCGKPIYITHFQRAMRIIKYLNIYLDKLLEKSLYEGHSQYKGIVIQAKCIIDSSVIVICIMGVIFCYGGIKFSSDLTKPIKKVVDSAKQMANGNLDVQEIYIDSTDEISDLSRSFNIMSNSIKNMLQDLNSKALIEKKLHEEEMKNIKNNQLLREAQFLALQSQINPHFLFNTLNTISRVVMFRRSEEAINLIDSLSILVRYNLQSASNYACLRDEINIIKQYVFIQQYRFKDRIWFECKCQDVDTKSILIPRFTLQPLIENAIIHGLEPKEQGGGIRLKAYVSNDNTIIKIIDNGVGMSKERINSIVQLKEQSCVGDTSSIGISNVLKRINIFCDNEEALKIRSKPGIGTIIEIKIPIGRGRLDV
ncbi:sensor histidine kinase [Clostridium novyi]|uniref:sensor histidine kinase n=1 Tax=Clostridium novyi TaxID=1542 RepID=UPI0018AFEA18|nr:histidine kinase [Clostridium novyi]